MDSVIGRVRSALGRAALIAGGVALAACAPAEQAAEAPEAPAADDTVRTVVDSIFPIEEALRRFRAALGEDAPAALSGGAASRDALVEGFVAAIEAADTAALRDLLLTPTEFAWLYYPHTRFTAPPYELAPALLWFQIENGTSRGVGRMLRRMGGRPAHVAGYECPGEALVEGPNRIWERCVARLTPPDGAARDFQLFGSILERDGIFKFVSYTNGF